MSRGEVSQARLFGTQGSSRYLNVVLTGIALALGVLALKQTVGLPQEAEAAGQRAVRTATPTRTDNAMGFPNAAEQRIRMIDSLNMIDGRLRAIESKLMSGPIDVRVIELPPEKVEKE